MRNKIVRERRTSLEHPLNVQIPAFPVSIEELGVNDNLLEEVE